jgi:site-specific recombinase XerD
MRELTLDLFVHEYNNFASRDCFLFFATSKNNSLYEKGINTYRTRLRHQTAINCLGDFVKGKQLLMKELNLEFIRQFDVWLRKVKKYRHNTIVGTHKVIKTYINYALKDGYFLDYSYTNFATAFREGDREALDRDELATLKTMLHSDLLNDLEKECLRKFLFSCYTGIRISDSDLLTSSMIKEGAIKMKMKKGERFGKEVKVPLPKYARELIEGRKGLIFHPYADKTVNAALKVIAAHAGITKNLSFHVSRDTFGTLFIELGGDIASLQELMGHSKIQTTMIYVKMSEQRKEKLMMNFDKLDE